MMPRLLLVEDDPVSLVFLRAALEALPATVDAATSMAEALTAAAGHDLWLIDANLPDGSGVALLARLRATSAAAAPALAHTADDSPALAQRLREAGFDGVVIKPVAAAELQAKVRSALGLPSPAAPAASGGGDIPTLPLWNDDAALAALNGNRDAVVQLRTLFLAELPGQCERIAAALRSGDTETAHGELHRLKASSGFVGALRLQTAVSALDESPDDTRSRDAFEEAARLMQSP